MQMQQLHRRTMSIFGVLLCYWVLSGLTIALYDANDAAQVWAGLGGGPGARLTADMTTARPVPAPEALSPGIERALADAWPMAVASVDLRMAGDNPRLQLAEASGERDTMRRYYAATGAPMSQQVADGDPFAHGPPPQPFRDWLKSWHKGDIAGLAGQVVALCAALVLLVMVITGVGTYLRLWRMRPAGRRAVFWNSRDSLWRRLHRWIAVVAAALLLNVAVTGTILESGEILLQLALRYHIGTPPYPMPTPLPPVSEAPLSGGLRQALQTSYLSGLAAARGEPIAVVQLVRRDGVQKGLVTVGGARPRILAFDMAGRPVADWATAGVQRGNGYFADWHQVLKRVHRGDIVGHFEGRYFAILVGFAFLYLVVSGYVLYVQLLRRRARVHGLKLYW